ncbi:MAG: hypothetical protein DRJ10_03340, partial [Bacteroidetes bacterium]
LFTDNNQLTELDISINDSLRKVSCSSNKIASLDCSNNTHLTSLTCSSNQLTNLNVQNGNNGILETFYSRNNPDLTCIEIDNESIIGESWEKDETASFAENCRYNETYVPDDNFEAALSSIIGEPGNNNDNYIPTADIEVLTSLNISNQNILDITGLQDFIALNLLNCSGNQIDSLEVSQNTNLTSLVCANNLLDSLALSDNITLQILDFSSNQLTKIDVSNNTALEVLDFSSNQFTEIDLSSNTALEILDFSSNQFTEIDVSNLMALTSLTCNSNGLTGLDLSNNGNLTSVNMASNQLTTLYVNNGNNNILTAFNATNNPDLGCIEVDDPAMANSGTGVYASWQTDTGISFSENCHYNQTYVPDDAFEQALKELGYDNSGTEPLDDYVPTSRINSITNLSIRNKGISDLTGIEDFDGLITLNCSNNLLTSLDFSENLALENLICSANQLSNLEISSNTILRKLEIADNLFTSINLSPNDSLRTLDCSINQLTSLNILNNTHLTSVNCSSNQLISVDANNGYNNILLSFDLRDNPKLTCILVDDITASQGYLGWYKDPTAYYKLECNDDDNDGVEDSEDQCPNTPFGDFVDLFGCSVFILPTDNYTIYSRSETCRSGNNGLINISAVEILNYTATLIGNEDTISHIFTDNLEIRNLRAGTYELCLTIADEPGYLQCYNIVITEPDDLDVQLKLYPSDNSVSLKMSGGINYTIDLNGLVFTTTDTEITLYLDKGKNTISVKTDVDCQGVFNKTLFLAEEPIVFPNPFEDYLNIYLGEIDGKNINVKMYSHSGQLIWSKQYMNQNGVIGINTSELKSGNYYLSVKSDTFQSTFKIIKE